MIITLKGRIPSKKNSKIFVNRGGRTFLIPSPQYTAWHEEQSWMVKKYKLVDVSSITITIYFPDMRSSDLTNKAESIMDLLVDSNIIKDDNWQCVPKLTLVSGGLDRLNPRAEIYIERK